MITCQQCREDLDEYALGPVDAAQAERMSSHLAACSVCRQEFEELQAAWSAVPRSLAPIAPRPELIDGVLARIDGDRIAVVAPLKRPPAKFQPARFQPTRRERVLSYVVAASVLIGLTASLWQLTRPADDEVARRSAVNLAERLGKLQQMERVLASKNVRLVSLKQEPSEGFAGDVDASVVWDLAARQWHFYADNLPPAPAGQAYQIWASGKSGEFLSGPTFEVNDQGLGSAVVDLPDLAIDGPAKVTVTLEPAGGSKQPTGKVFLEAAL